MAITVNCETIEVTFAGGSATFNKEITTTELAQDKVYLHQNSPNIPQSFWWDLPKAQADGFNTLQELYDFFTASIDDRCGSGGGGSSYIPPYLKTGGASWSGTGLVYDVTALEYYFNGDKLTAATQVTLDASDPIDNRLDAIVVDEEGVVSVIKGDASASPISPSVDESHILVQYILVEAGSTQPTIAKEDIYLENAEWTTSTYTTGAATGSIDFDNAVSPKQGVKCISANTDARLGARFVKTTSFDPYQYTMLSMWVRFTGSNVDTNKSLNVRFENGAGALVANTLNLFNFGLQRNLLNVWQLVVIPITSFGALPTSVKGLKIIMTGGTVGQARQWDIDLISLTDNSVPSINEQVFNILKDGTLVGQSSSLNFKGAAVTVTEDEIGGKIDIEVVASSSVKLSEITAATAANTIDNGLNKQEWQFNSHVSGSAFKLSAALNAAHTPVMGAAVFGVTLSNSYATPFSGTNYAAKFVNNYYSLGGYNTAVAGYFETGDPYDPKHSAVYARGNIRIEASTGKLYFGNYTRIHGADGSLIFSPSTSHTNNAGHYTYGMEAGYSSSFIRNLSSTTYTNWQSSYLYKDISSSRQVVAFGVDHDLYTTAGVGTSYGWIERNADKLMFAAQAGLSSRTPITPNYLLTCYGTNSNVGIGTTTPNSSAKLDVSSTTQGFAPPEMTATQASAISTNTRKLIIYVTSTNGTFTSAGLWMWTGTTWKLILAQ